MNLLKFSHIVFGAILSIFSLYAYFIAYKIWPSSEDAISKAAAFGDTFGVLTSLFSGLAFAGLILTVLLQRQELKEARDIFQSQKFEDAFYRLLDLHLRNLSAIKIKTGGSTDDSLTGVDAINAQLKKFITNTGQFRAYSQHPETLPIYEQEFFVEIQRSLAPQARYLGSFESILQLIDNELDNNTDKKTYYKILIAQLTSVEKRYIFYQCLVAPKESIIRDLIHKSGMIGSFFTGTFIRSVHYQIYEKIHNIAIDKPTLTNIRPHTQEKIEQLKRDHKDLIYKLQATPAKTETQ
ncbi:putative phage abortive infection protein [Ectopseudomonas composti]|uniref:putative phage abortive infection protein n=1 Tax=Ectopseudomonas composti TaxID=658457 RepID=UPI000F07FCDD|nr:putative phage abortive infection protein [Pseudomonas composti]